MHCAGDGFFAVSATNSSMELPILVFCSRPNHSPKMQRFELEAWDRETDGRTDGWTDRRADCLMLSTVERGIITLTQTLIPNP